MSRTHSGSPRAQQFAQKKQIAKASVLREFPEPTDDPESAKTPVFREDDWDNKKRPPSEDVGSYNS